MKKVPGVRQRSAVTCGWYDQPEVWSCHVVVRGKCKIFFFNYKVLFFKKTQTKTIIIFLDLFHKNLNIILVFHLFALKLTSFYWSHIIICYVMTSFIFLWCICVCVCVCVKEWECWQTLALVNRQADFIKNNGVMKRLSSPAEWGMLECCGKVWHVVV